MLINNPGKRKHRCNDLKMSVHLSYSLENVEREVSIVGKKREKELAKQVQGYNRELVCCGGGHAQGLSAQWKGFGLLVK